MYDTMAKNLQLAYDEIEGHVEELKKAEADESLIKRMDRLAEDLDDIGGDIYNKYVPCSGCKRAPCTCDLTIGGE